MDLKHIVLLIIALVSLTACQRQKSEIEPRGKLVKYPEHCYNGTTDGDEVGSDCGGSCPSCNVVVPTCTQSVNKMTFASTSDTLFGVSYGNLTYSYVYDFKYNYTGGSVTIMLGASIPDVTRVYNVSTHTDPDPFEATVMVNDALYGPMKCTSGQVYVSLNNKKYNVMLCGAVLSSQFMGRDYSAVINIQCP